MPGYKCSIKERMLYSSCKSRLLDSVEQDFRLEIAKKVGVILRASPLLAPGVCVPRRAEWGPLMPVGWMGRLRPKG